MTRHLPARAAAALAAALPLALLAGCSYTSPATTTLDYAPSDGIAAELGDVSVLNALVISPGEGEPGVLVAGVVNEGDEPAVVSLGVADVPDVATLELAAGETVLLGSGQQEGAPVPVVPSVDVVSGGTVPLRIAVPQGGGALDVAIPVYPPVREYAGIVPPEAPPAAEPEPAPAEPSPPPSPAPTASPSPTAGP